MMNVRGISKLGNTVSSRIYMGRCGFLGTRAFSSSPAAKKPDMSLIRELREASGAPIVDCKNALAADGVSGDLSLAFEWLRKRGIAKASAMADRSANEGLIGLRLEGSRGALVEVNSETDFVARNAKFQEFVNKVLAAALQEAERADGAGMAGVGEGNTPAMRNLDVQHLLGTEPPGSSEPLKDSLAQLVCVIRENITLSRAQVLSLEGAEGVVSGYVHAAVGPGMGKNAALVALKTESGAQLPEESLASLQACGRSLAMHVVAARPMFLDEASAPSGALQREKDLLLEQAQATGKDPKFLEKMVEGRLRKYLAEKALVDQAHMVEEGNPRVTDHLTSFGDKLGTKITVAGFSRLTVGERAASNE